jgi:hypothetical protein
MPPAGTRTRAAARRHTRRPRPRSEPVEHPLQRLRLQAAWVRASTTRWCHAAISAARVRPWRACPRTPTPFPLPARPRQGCPAATASSSAAKAAASRAISAPPCLRIRSSAASSSAPAPDPHPPRPPGWNPPPGWPRCAARYRPPASPEPPGAQLLQQAGQHVTASSMTCTASASAARAAPRAAMKDSRTQANSPSRGAPPARACSRRARKHSPIAAARAASCGFSSHRVRVARRCRVSVSIASAKASGGTGMPLASTRFCSSSRS